MAADVTNLVMGPAAIYIHNFSDPVSAYEPASSAVNTGPATTGASAWTDLGGTTDGAELTVDQSYEELECDQVVDIPGRRLTKRDMSVKLQLAEPTLENFLYALNDGETATGAGYKDYTPKFTDSATQPTYRSLLLHGWAPGDGGSGQSKRRMVILRKALSSDKVEFSYKKDEQTVFEATWSVHYVNEATAPFKIVDQA